MTVLQEQMKQKLITGENIDMLKILAHPVRLQIVDILVRHKKCNVTQLVGLLHIPQSTVSQHLSKMRGKVLGSDRKGLEVYYFVTNVTAQNIVRTLCKKKEHGENEL
ncbi:MULTISPECIES: ArsR/SmtB family transcription factor [Bacillus cereus group]|uniref:ArsR/SmtB family transcription factor n=1 Tax=Bacillus cereus group TaxID=86661 RepID=UPI002113515C|nr:MULTISPECIES: metalloregulator ArsR/SmtB family transcription factor [Bacillus cereus group]MCQ6336579.1 metalloregulator ArsR/SmtB family transcription factor [Bacillus cereus]MDF9490445.1 metalloregulator ArsR/SmtB family transcription factor [Bacillus cereus]MDF9512561.1 metalloregulator ArsR/SmtB family transcription factor [Bacillus paranthracis]MDG1622472.1 metalloregulator ArsR/SmtB family transcription factor [Bacillus mobilis]